MQVHVGLAILIKDPYLEKCWHYIDDRKAKGEVDSSCVSLSSLAIETQWS